jgi:hypothetical protein
MTDTEKRWEISALGDVPVEIADAFFQYYGIPMLDEHYEWTDTKKPEGIGPLKAMTRHTPGVKTMTKEERRDAMAKENARLSRGFPAVEL